jgi:hypothetical protein
MRWASGTGARIAIALVAGLVILVLFFPLSRADVLPVECSSAVGLAVTCDAALSLAAAAATVGILGALLWLRNRPL